VAVVGGSMLAMESALFLAGRGCEVTLVSHSGLGGRKGPDDMITFRGLMRKLIQQRVPLYLNVNIFEITERSLIFNMAGENISLTSDAVVLAVGVQPLDKLIDELKKIVPEIYPIGDCMMPGNAAQATYSAFRMASRL
jgi:pyruvate/2-oxoglutarate dehydrogenase complex dihydrolipoamide dehydrogenase (E3) component